MKCQICKENIATQKELLTTFARIDHEKNTEEVSLTFVMICKTCSLEKIDYDQETIDAILQDVAEAAERGATIETNWDKTGEFTLDL